MHGIGVAVYVPVCGLFTGEDEQMSYFFFFFFRQGNSLLQ